MGHLASTFVNARKRFACVPLLLAVGGCVPFAVVEERTGAVVENRDNVGYLLDVDRGDAPGGVGHGLVWTLPANVHAWAFDVSGSEPTDLVLLTTSCIELDRIAVQGTVSAVVDGGVFVEVGPLSQPVGPLSSLSEGRSVCGGGLEP
jgi:hypothetical protein